MLFVSTEVGSLCHSLYLYPSLIFPGGFETEEEDDSEYGSDANSFIMAPAEVDIEDADGFDTDVEVDEKGQLYHMCINN